MKRGDLFRVYRGNNTDTKDFRVFVVISRQLLINSKFSTVICAPIYSAHDGISTQQKIKSLRLVIKNNFLLSDYTICP